MMLRNLLQHFELRIADEATSCKLTAKMTRFPTVLAEAAHPFPLYGAACFGTMARLPRTASIVPMFANMLCVTRLTHHQCFGTMARIPLMTTVESDRKRIRKTAQEKWSANLGSKLRN